MSTSLPTCLSCSVLCEWLRLNSLARLDSAFCNQNVRPLFLELMRCRECVSGHIVSTSTPRLLAWLLVRVLKVSRMIVYCAHAQLTTYLVQNATTFQELGLYQEVFQYLPNVKFPNLIALTCTLRLSSCGILANLPRLRRLYLTLKANFDNNLTVESYYLPELDHLDVRWYEHLPGGSILAVVRMARSLRHLSLETIHNAICHTEWVSIAKCCPQLLAFSVWTKDLSDATLDELSRLCPHITTLAMGYSGSITDAGVLLIAQRLQHLQSLVLNHCQQLTDLSLAHIDTHCQELRTLKLLCKFVTPSAEVELQRRLEQKHSA